MYRKLSNTGAKRSSDLLVGRGEEVGNERGEAGRNAGLRDDAELELAVADWVVADLERVPAPDVVQEHLRAPSLESAEWAQTGTSAFG